MARAPGGTGAHTEEEMDMTTTPEWKRAVDKYKLRRTGTRVNILSMLRRLGMPTEDSTWREKHIKPRRPR